MRSLCTEDCQGMIGKPLIPCMLVIQTAKPESKIACSKASHILNIFKCRLESIRIMSFSAMRAGYCLCELHRVALGAIFKI